MIFTMFKWIYFYHVKIIRISVFYINAQVKQWLFYTLTSIFQRNCRANNRLNPFITVRYFLSKIKIYVIVCPFVV